MPREGHYKPRLYDEELNMDQINFICVLYHNYRYGKRPLMLEEINGIIGLKRDRVPPSNQMMWGIYQKLDDPQSPLMREFEERSSSFSEKKIVGLLDEIERLHSELRGRDKIFKDIAENLSGLTVRLPSPPLGTRPVWNNSKLRWDQLFLMYPLPNWCKDHDGNLIPQGYCRTIAEQLLGEAKNSEVFKTLSDPSKRVTSLLAEGMENRVIAEFCMNKARKMHLNFTIKSNLQLPWGETSTDSIAGVSHAMENSSIGVTAGPWQQDVAYEEWEESPSPDPEPRTRRRRFEDDLPRRQRTGASSSGVPASTSSQAPMSYSKHEHVPPADTVRTSRPKGQQQPQGLPSFSTLTSYESNPYGSPYVSNPYGPPNASNPNVAHHTVRGQGRIQQQPGMDNREPTHDSPFHNTSSQQQQGWTITNDQEATRLQSKADKAMEAEKQIRKRKRAEEEAKAKKVEKEKKEKEERERKRKRDAEDEKRPWFI